MTAPPDQGEPWGGLYLRQPEPAALFPAGIKPALPLEREKMTFALAGLCDLLRL